MIPVDQVIRNQIHTDNKLHFEKMTLAQLNYHHKKLRTLKTNAKLLSTLKDKGEKVTKQIEQIEQIIQTKFGNSSKMESVDQLLEEFSNKMKFSNKNEHKANLERIFQSVEAKTIQQSIKEEPKIDQNLAKKFKIITDLLDEESAKQEVMEDLKSKDNMDKINELKKNKQPNEDNYFLLKEDKNELIKKKIVTNCREKDLYAIKTRINEKYRADREAKMAKCISIAESFQLTKEQNARAQELQIQQTTERLLKLGSVANYDYSFASKEKISSTRYRNVNNGDEDYAEESSSEISDIEEESNFDKIHMKEVKNRQRYGVAGSCFQPDDDDASSDSSADNNELD